MRDKNKSDWEDAAWEKDYAQALGVKPKPRKEKPTMRDSGILVRLGWTGLGILILAINWAATKYYFFPITNTPPPKSELVLALLSIPMLIVPVGEFFWMPLATGLAVLYGICYGLFYRLPKWIATGK